MFDLLYPFYLEEGSTSGGGDQTPPTKEDSTQEGETSPPEPENVDALKGRLGKTERDLKKATQKLQELEAEKKQRDDAEKSELQKAQDRVKELEENQTRIELDVFKTEKLIEKGIPLTNKKFIAGATKEEIEENVEEYYEAHKASFTKGNGSAGRTSGGSDHSGGSGKTFKRSQLQDPKFYSENREAIMDAMHSGRIVDDINPRR